MGFERAFEFVLAREGGFVDDPDDRGGRTNFGVTQGTYDAFRTARGWAAEDVKDISEAEVRTIYFEGYYSKGKADLMVWPLCLVHFDACVNHGVDRANRLLQAAIGGISVDGVIGSQTLGELRRIKEGLGAHSLCHDYIWKRLHLYRLLSKKPGQLKFLPNWLTRMEHLWAEIK